MNLKTLLIILTSSLFSTISAQEHASNLVSAKNIDSQIESGSFKENDATAADKLVINPSQEIENTEKEERNWKKIKRQLKRNKKRILRKNEEELIVKRIDTVFIPIAYKLNDTQLSDW